MLSVVARIACSDCHVSADPTPPTLHSTCLPSPPFSRHQLVFMITSGERLPVPALADLPGAPPPAPLYEAFVALMRRCWAQDPADRPTFSQVIVELRGILGRHASFRALLLPDASGGGADGGTAEASQQPAGA